MIGKTVLDAGVLPWNPELRDLLGKLRFGEHSWCDIEVVQEVPRLGPRLLRLNAEKVSGASIQPELIVIRMEDVTEQRRTEEGLRTNYAAMERQATELRRSNSELEQFAHVASHDLRAPLLTIHLYTQLLERQFSGTLNEETSLYFEYILQAARGMTALIDNLLAYAQVSNQNSEAPAPIEAGTVLEEALANLRAHLVEANALVDHGSLPTVLAPPSQFSQLMQNLVANAVQYRNGKRPEVHVSAEKVEEEWVFAVRDNGIGIDPQHCQTVFEPFKRLHGIERPGSGLGLAICRKIVERWGGKIWVKSEVNQGSVFYFTIPA